MTLSHMKAQMNFTEEFPILRFLGNENQSFMQYEGPKDVDSLMFFIQDMTGNGVISALRKVNIKTRMDTISE